MPIPKSTKQYGFMQWVAHNAKAASKTGLSQESAHRGIMELSPAKRKAFAKKLRARRAKGQHGKV